MPRHQQEKVKTTPKQNREANNMQNLQEAKRHTEGENLRKRLQELYEVTYSYPAIARSIDNIVSSTHLQNFSTGRYDIAPPTKREICARLEKINEGDLRRHIRRRGRPRKMQKSA